MGKTVKYMGTADVRRLPKGSDFGGRLQTPTSQEVVFNRENNWVVDVSDANLSDEAVNLLLESGDFADVSDKERIPTNGHQRMFLSMSDEAPRQAEQPAQQPLGEEAPPPPDQPDTTSGDEPTKSKPSSKSSSKS